MRRQSWVFSLLTFGLLTSGVERVSNKTHIFDRLSKGGYALAGQTESGFLAALLRKDGEFNQRTFIYFDNPVTALNVCEVCARIGTIRQVRYRTNISGWDLDGYADRYKPSKTTLCTACWNRVRALHKRANECEELRKLIKNTIKELKNGSPEKHDNSR